MRIAFLTPKSTILFIFFLGVIGSAFAFVSDSFLLGTYEIKNVTQYEMSNRQLLSRMKEAHFNSVAAVNREHYYYQDRSYTYPFQRFLDQLRLNDLNAMIIDTYYPDYPVSATSEMGIEFLTSSNYFRFESEYGKANTEVNPGDLNSDLYFYRFDRERGIVDDSSTTTSNGHSWYCPVDSTSRDRSWKIVSGDMLRRWVVSADTLKVDWIFRFAMNWEPSIYREYLKNSRLYISIALKWDEIPDCEDSLLSIQFAGLTVPHIDPNNNQVPALMKDLNFKAEGNYTNHLRISDFSQGTPDHNLFSDFRIFTYSIRLDSLKTPDPNEPEQTLLYNSNALKYVVPIISWKQNHPVSIDYIEYEDTIHKLMRINTKPNILDAWIKRRIETFNYRNKNIACYWAVDEPVPGNYDSCKLINDYLLSLDFGVNHPLITNINRWSQMQKTDGTYFDNTKLFSQLGNPSILCFDQYPLENNVLFNNTSPGNSRFIQNKINTALKVYEGAKRTKLPFIAVTQSFGDWDPVKKQFWGKIYPPPSTQKFLQYLPLCYGADGIINFATKHGNPNILTALNQDLSPTPNFYAIKEANDKINTYGPILKKAIWQGTDCIVNSSYSEDLFEDGTVHLAAFSIAPEGKHCFLAKSRASYNGYVQCGYFQTGSEKYYMFVNRRAEYLKSGYNAITTPVKKYKKAYRLTYPQTVQISLLDIDQAVTQYGKWLGLYDPYSKDLQFFNKGLANIKLNPGDASLRQYVESLPNNVTSSVTIKNLGVFQQKTEIRIQDGCVVTIAPGATVRMLKNCRIVVEKGGQFINNGNLEYERKLDIKAKPGGKVEMGKTTKSVNVIRTVPVKVMYPEPEKIMRQKV